MRMPKSADVMHMMTMEDQLVTITDVPFEPPKESLSPLRWYKLVSFSNPSSHGERCAGQSVAAPKTSFSPLSPSASTNNSILVKLKMMKKWGFAGQAE